MRTRIKTTDAAQGKWRGILIALGVDEAYLQNRHGPCPLCGGNDRFRWDDKNGAGTFYCNGCGAGDGMRLALEFTGEEFAALAKRIDGLIGNIEPDQASSQPRRDPTEFLNRILRQIRPCIGDTPVHRYMARRGLQLSPALKFHPEFGYFEQGQKLGAYPAMVAQLILPDGKPATFHVTFLTADGHKAPVSAPKKLMPPARPLDGGAVRLSPIAEHIGIAEGIETALAATQLFAVPTWAALNSNLLKKFSPPAGVRRVTIFGDNDANYEGQSAAYGLARDLSRKGYVVQVFIPEQTGIDFADMAEVRP